MKLSPEEIEDLRSTIKLKIVQAYARKYKIKGVNTYQLHQLDELRDEVLRHHEEDFDPHQKTVTDSIQKIRDRANRKYQETKYKQMLARYEKKIEKARSEGDEKRVEKLLKVLELKRRVVPNE